MWRFRILALVTTALAFLLQRFSFNLFMESLDWRLVFLVVVATFCTVAGMLITVLSFFSVARDASGTYIINRNSMYGRMFRFVSKRTDETSFCVLFWKTNLAVIKLCILTLWIALVVAICIGIVLNWRELLIGLLFIVCFAGVLMLIGVGVGMVRDAVRNWYSRRSQKTRDRLDSIKLWSLASVGVAFVLGVLFGIGLLFTHYHLWRLVCIVLASVLLCAGGWYARHSWRAKHPKAEGKVGEFSLMRSMKEHAMRLEENQFVATTRDIHHNWLCPRIRIE